MNQTMTNLPFIILHCFPNQDLSDIEPRLGKRFRLLDPHHPSFSTEDANLSRVLFCIGRPAPVNAGTLDRYPSIECVIGTSVGIDHVDLDECRRRGVRVTNAGDAFSVDVADYAIGLLIDVLRRVSASHRFVRAGSWSTLIGDYPLGYKLGGKHIGIIGLGNIGLRIATRLEAFGCVISYTCLSENPNWTYTYVKSVDNLARKCKVLIACCSLNDQTHHIINRETMMLLGKEGVVINVGRGGLVDERALVEALVNGELGGAGLDVFEEEPNVPEELFQLENVVLSSHCAVYTPEAMDAIWNVAEANIEAFFANEPLQAEVK